MTFDIKAMRKNRDAGTMGEWFYDDSRAYETVVTDVAGEEVRSTAEPGDAVKDALRIASVPSMEAEIERLTAENSELRAEIVAMTKIPAKKTFIPNPLF